MSDNGDHRRGMLGLVAHELRSPLSVIAGYLRLLLKQFSGEWSPSQRTYIEEAGRCCARVMHLAQELEELAALEGVEASDAMTDTEIFGLCQDVAKEAGDGSPNQSSVVFTCAKEDQTATVLADVGLLRKALAALIAGTSRELAGGQPLEAYGFVSGADGIRRAVVALGPMGLASKRDAIIADTSLDVDRWRGGTGLSLPIAYRIIESHGGRLWRWSGDSRAAMAFSLPLISID